MPSFLIDANLPYYFSLWNTEEYIHVRDLDDTWSDTQIWQYAQTHHLTIISKDSDFSNRILPKEPPPKVIHIRLGNVKMIVFFEIITKCWKDVLELSAGHKLVNVFKDRLEAVN